MLPGVYQIMAGDAMNTKFRPFVALALSLTLVACGGAATQRPPLEGAAIGGPFALTGQDGKTVRDSDFAGKYRIMYFGYTYCPDVCPNDMQKLGRALRDLAQKDPARAEKVALVFVSVDPERDTPAAVTQFAHAFHPDAVGLTGTPDAIAAVAKEYAVYYKKQAPGADGVYLVDHSTVAYLMDPDGKPIALLTHEMTPDQVTAELERWIR